MRRPLAASFATALLAFLFVPGCGGGGGSSGTATSGPAATMDAQLKSGMVRFMVLVTNVDSSFLYLFNGGAGLTPNVAVTPGTTASDLSFNGTYDGNRDGFDETTLAGTALFGTDPNVGWSDVGGQVVVDVAIPVVGHLYHSDLTYTITSTTRQLSGSGRFTDPMTGNVTTLTVDPGAPLVVQPADDAAGLASNACGYNIAGAMRISVSGSGGTLSSTWNFSTTSPSVAITTAAFTDSHGDPTYLPDSTVDLRCGTAGTINDWVGTFDQRWVCLPRENGQSLLTLSVTAPDTITVSDEDPPGSGNGSTYSATVVSANPHALRGFFIGGPMGARYREDFTWTLSKSGNDFFQVSRYTFIEGPSTGQGGVCASTARRM